MLAPSIVAHDSSFVGMIAQFKNTGSGLSIATFCSSVQPIWARPSRIAATRCSKASGETLPRNRMTGTPSFYARSERQGEEATCNAGNERAPIHRWVRLSTIEFQRYYASTEVL